MDFDVKKARTVQSNKHRQDKAKAKHRDRPDSRAERKAAPGSSDRNKGPGGGHATPLRTQDKPASYTATDPEQFQHLKRETDDIAALTETKSYSRRVIVSNWERYELPPDSTADDQNDETLDFETLVSSLPDAKGHMKLRHEQTWGSERTELQETFFNIDMEKLSLSLHTVPFHIRHSLPVSLFTDELLTAFEQSVDEFLMTKKLVDTITNIIATPEVLAVNNIVPPVEEKVVDLVLTPVIPAKTAEESSELAKSDDIIPQNIGSCSKPLVISVTETRQERGCASTFAETADDEKPAPAPAGATVVPSCSKTEELDLDFLLSLEAAVPETPKVPPRVLALQVNPAAGTSPKGSTSIKKLDDWLDDILDD